MHDQTTSAAQPTPQEHAVAQGLPAGDDGPQGIAAIREYIDKLIKDGKIDKDRADWRTRLPRFPEVTFDKGKTYYWQLKTNMGMVKVKFMPEVAPKHVANFIYLTELGYYNGLTFHRVITGFMAQGGCPIGDGKGSPGYAFGGEFDPNVKHDTKGMLSMANSGPNTDGSQFFLTFAPTPWLDMKHTVAGRVVEGFDTLEALEKRGSAGGRTSEKLFIEIASVTVE